MPKTKIGWTKYTWNPWMGCKKISAGCKNCYMFRKQKRYGNDPTEIRRSKTTFKEPLRWKDPGLVFTCSWSDFFIEEADPWRDEAWGIIKATPHLTYQILTKRPERIHENLPADFFPRNVWWGISAEDQASLDLRWPILDLSLYGNGQPVKFVSAEPLLGPIDFSEFMTEHALDLRWKTVIPDWIIVGGESGPNHRQMDLGWLKDIYWQCKKNEISLFVKQDSGNRPGQKGRIPNDLWIQEFPEIERMAR